MINERGLERERERSSSRLTERKGGRKEKGPNERGKGEEAADNALTDETEWGSRAQPSASVLLLVLSLSLSKRV